MKHNKWSIDKGDYVRDDESTNSYEKKVKRINILVKIGKVIGAIILVSILAFLITL